jgi:hypothetical protein
MGQRYITKSRIMIRTEEEKQKMREGWARRKAERINESKN